MATFAAGDKPQTNFEPLDRFGLGDQVSVPDGRVGRVIGFHLRQPERALVFFDVGDSGQYAPGDLRRVG